MNNFTSIDNAFKMLNPSLNPSSLNTSSLNPSSLNPSVNPSSLNPSSFCLSCGHPKNNHPYYHPFVDSSTNFNQITCKKH